MNKKEKMEKPVNDNGINTLISHEETENSAISIIPTEILQYILQLLQLRDILTCREVSHQWKSAATLPARKKCDRIPFSAEIDMHERIKVLKDFNDCVSGAEGEFPVSRFHLAWNSTDRWIEFEDCVAACFRKVSEFISELSMDFRLGAIEVPMNALVISQQQPSYEKLKCLRLKVLSDYNGAGKKKFTSLPNADDNSIFTFVRSLIANAPNLDNVQLKLESDIKQRNTIPRCVDEFGIREKLKILTSLSIRTPFDNVDWETLTRMGLKLKIFHITLGHCPLESNILKAFLESQENTLRDLKISYEDCGHGHHVISIDFPCLPQVTKLKIDENYDPDTHPRRLNFPTLSYQEQLPALKELSLLFALDTMYDLFTSRIVPLCSLEKLTLQKPLSWVDRVEMLQICRTFPNVKILHLSHDLEPKTHLNVIYQNLAVLEELWITITNDCVDYIVTGLTVKQCANIKEPPSESFTRAAAKLDSPTWVTLNRLKNLKVLKILRRPKNFPVKVEITEISGHILKQMKSFECLHFGVRKYAPLISEDFKEDLKKHGINVIFTRQPRRRTKLGLRSLTREGNSGNEDNGNN